MPQWEIYPTQLHDEMILVLVDLDWHDHTDIGAMSQLNWFRVDFDGEGQQGMPGSEDRELLERFNDWLIDEYEGNGELVARLTGPGRREFFVYSALSNSEALIDRARTQFEGIRVSARTRPDPQWQLYNEFLYPDAVQMARIRALGRTRLMREDGDVLAVPRPVDHVAGFHSEEQRELFRAFAIGQGFDVVDEKETDDEAISRPFLIRLNKTHALDPVGVEHNVIRLFVKVRELGGDYGGWVTSVIKA